MIYTENTGIYSILHRDSGHRYIGQAVDLKRRITRHWTELRSQYHSNEHLQRAFNKYGREAFDVSILEYCAREILTDREQYWIDHFGFQNLFNHQPIAGKQGGRPLPLETRLKIAAALKGRKRNFSPQALENIREAARNRKGIRRGPVSKEALENLRRSFKYRRKPVITEERKRKQSEFFKTIPRTKEWCEKISAGLKKASVERKLHNKNAC